MHYSCPELRQGAHFSIASLLILMCVQGKWLIIMQGFMISSLLAFWAGLFVVQGCLSLEATIPTLYSVDANSTFSRCDYPKCQKLPKVPMGQNSPRLENHCCNRINHCLPWAHAPQSVLCVPAVLNHLVLLRNTEPKISDLLNEICILTR